MNANVKLWIDALRSGNYHQGPGFLHRRGLPDTWCCLGIACDVYQREVGDLKEDDALNAVAYDDAPTVLPVKVKNWLGLRTSQGDYGGAHALSEDNDDGKTFEEIADTIEAEPEGLFA